VARWGAAGQRRCRRRVPLLGLPRGQYTLKAGGKEWEVLVNGDAAVEMAGKGQSRGGTKKILGVILILAVNSVGSPSSFASVMVDEAADLFFL